MLTNPPHWQMTYLLNQHTIPPEVFINLYLRDFTIILSQTLQAKACSKCKIPFLQFFFFNCNFKPLHPFCTNQFVLLFLTKSNTMVFTQAVTTIRITSKFFRRLVITILSININWLIMKSNKPLRVCLSKCFLSGVHNDPHSYGQDAHIYPLSKMVDEMLVEP